MKNKEIKKNKSPSDLEDLCINPDMVIKIAKKWKQDQQGRIDAEKRLEENRAKVIFAEAVSASKSTILVGELAKILKQNGVEMGQNRLFNWLRNNGYLIKRQGEDYNMPTQKSMELDLFEIEELAINRSDGQIKVVKIPKVTGKGQIYFISKFKKG